MFYRNTVFREATWNKESKCYVRIICDFCGELSPCAKDDDIYTAITLAEQTGWQIYKNKYDIWMHWCARCSRTIKDKHR